MITRLRKESKKVLRPIATALVKLGIRANEITVLGLVLSIAYFIVIYLTKNPLFGAILVALSSFSDALDGEIARISGSAGSKGAFLDSSLDRIEDTLFLSSLAFYFQPILVALLVGISLIIPYLRARAEALGIKAEGRGIIERGERIILTLLILILLFINFHFTIYIFYIFILLSIVTVIQRFQLVLANLPK
ncbi:archaetidylinositol phosphate synthase [Acidianus sp. HS-5]|uniref:archaetidylinositol phosphate synthase n=1 Tax=Acidianus sp. HS-5 TaxID=2886040 RepID=UPI001F21AA80|nr:archaetidylinositol phosphate synthase [Acidianus sp. HS-5]BDC19689.1 CDP-alcohol phosphatidyltransferase [Acidianus sp. HS-5]